MKQPSESTTLGALFALAIRAEQHAQALYERLAECFAELPEVAEFWLDLARDEAQHAASVGRMRAALSEAQLGAPADPELIDKASAVEPWLRVSVTGTIRTLQDAYELAHDLEFSEVNHVFLCLAERSIPRIERRDLYFETVERHQKKLLDFSQRFGGTTWRQGIAAQHPSATAA